MITKKYAQACISYEEVLSACKLLEKNPSVQITELAKLYDLKARICSNLERAYKGNKNLPKAGEYLEEGIKNCKDAIARIGDVEETDLLKLKEEFSDFQKNSKCDNSLIW